MLPTPRLAAFANLLFSFQKSKKLSGPGADGPLRKPISEIEAAIHASIAEIVLALPEKIHITLSSHRVLPCLAKLRRIMASRELRQDSLGFR